MHHWLLHAANLCARAGMAPEAAAELIRVRMTRPPRGTEIPDAIRKAFGEIGQPIGQWRGAREHVQRVSFNPDALARVARSGPLVDAAWLRARSPLDPMPQSPATYLHAVFRPGDRVMVCGALYSQGEAIWNHSGPTCAPAELDEFREGWIDGVWFPANPVDGQWREVERLRRPGNERGRTRRAEENITAFRHVVIESDRADPALWLSAIAQMPLPIVSLVSSGGKSIHALIRINASDGDEWRAIVGRLKPILVTLGADPAAMSAVRLTRLPGCMRVSKGRLQELLFLNPHADGTPIHDLPVMRDVKEVA